MILSIPSFVAGYVRLGKGEGIVLKCRISLFSFVAFTHCGNFQKMSNRVPFARHQKTKCRSWVKLRGAIPCLNRDGKSI